MVELLTVVGLIGAGIFSGVLVGVQLSIVPLFKPVRADDRARLHQRLNDRFDPFMPALNAVTTLVVAGWAIAEDQGRARALVAFGITMAVAVALISVIGNGPINRLARTWEEDEPVPPAGAVALRRWSTFHLVRTLASVAGLVAYVVAAVTGR